MTKLFGARSQQAVDRIKKFLNYENELAEIHTLKYENITTDDNTPLRILPTFVERFQV